MVSSPRSRPTASKAFDAAASTIVLLSTRAVSAAGVTIPAAMTSAACAEGVAADLSCVAVATVATSKAP
jgi:hypothetical protein